MIKSDQDLQTIQAITGGGGEVKSNTPGTGGRNTSDKPTMGLESSRGGHWAQKAAEVKISKIKNWSLCPRCKDSNKQAGSTDDRQIEALSPSSQMTDVFREQARKIRAKSDAVLCVNAVNPQGSLISTLRNYVGGNPIILAVTRFDLLPDYVTQDDEWGTSHKSADKMKTYFRELAKELQPADVYLCSVDDQYQEKESIFNGPQQLADDLVEHLNGRDTYVVGVANIGKSTLTDRLIDNIIVHDTDGDHDRSYRKQKEKIYLIEKEQKKKKYGRSDGHPDTMDQKRYEPIQEVRVSKSSLPGTTLNNVRIPCFKDYQQALWDTPGLLLDPSLKHYPIRNFRRIKAMKPQKIRSQWHDVDKMGAFSLLVFESSEHDEEDDDPLPLLRIDIRMKKNNQNEIPSVQLVWNSILNSILSTRVVSIHESHAAEKKRIESVQLAKEEEMDRAAQLNGQGEEMLHRTPEEKAKYKELKRVQFHQEKRKAEIAELGREKWKALQKQKEEKFQEELKLRRLAALSMISQGE